MTQKRPLAFIYYMIDVSAINEFVILERNKSCKCNICMRQRRMFLIRIGKEQCGITEEAQSVASIFATRKRNVILAANGALLKRRSRCTLCDRKENQKCLSFYSKCDKHVCPEHSDIVFINFAWLLLLLLLLSLFSFVFICRCF